MKKNIFIIVLVLQALIVGNTFAQEDSLAWRQTMARHDIQIGIGDPIIAGFITDDIDLAFYKHYYDDIYYNPDSWFTQDVFKGGSYTTGAISAGYRYRLAKWFWIGGTIGYVGFHNDYIDRPTRKKAGSDHTNFFMIMPSVRFSWVNTRYVTLYSGLSLGYAIATERRFDKISGSSNTNIGHYFAIQVTAVGVHVGTKWYGFTEIGAGTQGIISAGFGCQLGKNNKKSK